METKIYLILGGIVFLTITFGGMWYLIKVANKFFREADRIENLIRTDAPQNEVIAALYALRKDSFHRQTGERLSELAKMAEIKYNVSILKR